MCDHTSICGTSGAVQQNWNKSVEGRPSRRTRIESCDFTVLIVIHEYSCLFYFAWPRVSSGNDGLGLACACVFFPFISDMKFVGRTSRGHTGGR